MTTTATMHVYVVDLQHPTRVIAECELPITLGTRLGWATLPGGARRVVGCSVFFTRLSAERRRRSLLERIIRSTYVRRYLPYVHHRAVQQLKTIH